MDDFTRLHDLQGRVRQAAGRPGSCGTRGLNLNLDFLRRCGAKPDLLHSWQHGKPLHASAGKPTHLRNHPSLLQQAQLAKVEWERLETLGKVSLFDPGAPRSSKLNVNPCALLLKARDGVSESAPMAERMKARLIVDLTRGLVNPRLPQFGVAYGTIDLAVSRMTANQYLFVVDLKDAFFNWRISPDDSWELGFYCPASRRFGKYNFCPFGLSIAPGINDESTKELLRLHQARSNIQLTDFVDDLLGGGRCREEAWYNLEGTVQFFIDAGVPVSDKPSGIRTPAQRQTWIGWIFDTAKGTVEVSSDKCDKCRNSCLQTLEADDSRLLRARPLAACAGLASHIAEVYPQARRRLHPIWADLNAVGVYHMWAHSPSANPLVQLSDSSRSSLVWLIGALATPPVRVLHCRGGSLSCWGPRSPEFADWEALALRGDIHVIETDASKLHGWSYHLCNVGRVVSGEWPEDFAEYEGLPNADHINYKELWVVVRCLQLEQELLRGWRVLFRVDNVAAVHYTNIRYGRVPSLEDLTVQLEAAERAASCWALAKHLQGVLNVVADAGSRDSTFAGRWASDSFREAKLRVDLFNEIAVRCGVTFTLDLFADRAGINALAPSWRCPQLSAFEAVLDGVVWAHPPRDLLLAVLRFLNATLRSNAALKVVLLAPEDSRAPWFRSVLRRGWHRVRSWSAGSDLFRWQVLDRTSGSVRWRRGPRSDLPYHVFQSWLPARRL